MAPLMMLNFSLQSYKLNFAHQESPVSNENKTEVGVMGNTDCQLDKIYNYVEDKTRGMYVREFLN